MDLHDRFGTWLADGAPGEPARDLALHAAGCDSCLLQASAVDALGRIDLGAAPLPPPIAAPLPRAAGLVGPTRALATASALVLVAVAALIGGGALLENRDASPGGAALLMPTPAEGVLGDAGAPDATATATATATERATAEDSPTPSAEPTRPY